MFRSIFFCHHQVVTAYVKTLLLNYYSETSIHRFRRGSVKETMEPEKQ
jgi:hypothetical protein